MSKRDYKIYLCNNCGNEFSAWVGQCPACGEWNTLIKMNLPEQASRRGIALSAISVQKLADIKIDEKNRFSSGIAELDRVLGGGIVPASLILIGGEPGIGKSTLLLQTADNITDCFYVSAEESLTQIKDRALRLGIKNKSIRLSASGDLELLESEILKKKPALLIIDSIQTVYLNSIAGSAGSLLQVRECGLFLQRLAKISGIATIIVGHVTKEGSLAGPRTLEHLVDTVLYFEGDRFHDGRILRTVKNRFGPTNEVGIFSITDKGLIGVSNPSKIFLSQRENNPGSVVTATLEGTRPLLVEVQALAVPTNFGYPKRTASGFDLNRLNLLAAVISKNTKVKLGNFDIYQNVVGGMRLREPAIDLAVCAAIISSCLNKLFAVDLCLFGEVGLSGEIRRVSREKDREKEAKQLGFKVISKIKNLSDLISLLI